MIRTTIFVLSALILILAVPHLAAAQSSFKYENWNERLKMQGFPWNANTITKSPCERPNLRGAKDHVMETFTRRISPHLILNTN